MALLRWLGLDRNPLRRPTDRIETLVQIMLLAAFVACAPPLASAAGRMAAGQSRPRWTQVTAVIAAPAWRPAAARGAAAGYWMPATWRDSDGVARRGAVPATAGITPGLRVQVWAAGDGELAGAPPRPVPPVPGLIVAAWGAALASLGLGLLLLAGLARWVLDRRRMRSWAAAWTVVAPRWTAHR